MGRTLYDLAGGDPACRFSPFCWRSRLALAHKGLEVKAVPWRFTECERLGFSGQDKVPVLEDSERVVADSWAIATYLEEAYPGRASLFGGPAGRALSRFTVDWTDMSVHGGLIRMLALDIHDRLHPKDREYYRRTREARFGMTLEAFCEGRESRLPEFRKSLAPLRATLKQQPFLGGEARSSRTTWSSAPCNGRAASTPSRCWKPKIP